MFCRVLTIYKKKKTNTGACSRVKKKMGKKRLLVPFLPTAAVREYLQQFVEMNSFETRLRNVVFAS